MECLIFLAHQNSKELDMIKIYLIRYKGKCYFVRANSTKYVHEIDKKIQKVFNLQSKPDWEMLVGPNELILTL